MKLSGRTIGWEFQLVDVANRPTRLPGCRGETARPGVAVGLGDHLTLIVQGLNEDGVIPGWPRSVLPVESNRDRSVRSEWSKVEAEQADSVSKLGTARMGKGDISGGDEILLVGDDHLLLE